MNRYAVFDKVTGKIIYTVKTSLEEPPQVAAEFDYVKIDQNISEKTHEIDIKSKKLKQKPIKGKKVETLPTLPPNVEKNALDTAIDNNTLEAFVNNITTLSDMKQAFLFLAKKFAPPATLPQILIK